jgi:TetR/AcrR family fatty acid metabolism transcriptional regulator
MTSKKTDKYELIIESAIQLYAKKGFHNTKIKDITDNASLAAGTFYLYFKNKEDLLEALLKKYLELGFVRLEDIYHQNIPAKEKLLLFISENIDFFFDHQYFFMIYAEYSSKKDEFHPIKKHYEFIIKYLDMVSNIIKQGQNEGQFKQNINLKIASRSLRGMIVMNLIAILVFKDPSGITKEELSDNISGIFINGISV